MSGQSFNERAEALGHKLRRDEDGNVDIFVCDSDYHNGPGCETCGDSWCHHCNETIKPCDGGVRKRAYEAKERVRASAPDLLEALKACRAELALVQDGSTGGVPHSVFALIPEAIEKADAAISRAEAPPIAGGGE